MKARTVTAVVVAMVLVLGACGDDDDSKNDSTTTAAGEALPVSADCNPVDGTDDAADSEVAVELSEFSVSASPDSTTAGNVTLAVDNLGALDHELVIVKGVPADDLTVVDGKVDEDALPEGAFIGEIEEFGSQSSCEGTYALEADSYVVFCNLVTEDDDGAPLSHFEEGMVTTLEVQ